MASSVVEGFSLDPQSYRFADGGSLSVKGVGSCDVLSRSQHLGAQVSINVSDAHNCKVYVGHNVKGKIRVSFKGNGSTLWIGNGCVLNDLEIRSFQDEDVVVIGNRVTTTAKNVWISGNGAGSKKPAIIIGDDCMFSYDIVLRNSDAHPIYSFKSGCQVNEPEGIILIEPHVWIGEQVNILKSVKVGACSVIALGSLVTKDIPRFSIARGVPAVARVDRDLYWSRGEGEDQKARARYFVEKYSEQV